MAIPRIKTDLLEMAVDQFELAWGTDRQLSIEQVVQSLPDTVALEVIVELARIEIELLFQRSGQRPTTADYLKRFPQLGGDKRALGEIAFEEYRQLHLAGESVEPETWHRNFDIPVDHWPKWDSTSSSKSGSASAAQTPVSGSRSISSSEFQSSLPRIGSRWQGFEIVGQLGKGAYGSVFLARQESLSGRLVVLKFSPPVSEEPQFLARLQHTNIVPVYSVHPAERCLSICMPFLGIATLADLSGYVTSHPDISQQVVTGQQLISTVSQLREETVERELIDPALRKAFQSRKARANSPTLMHPARFDRWTLETMCRVLDGLEYAHRRGVVHGDLKPANVLLSDDGEPVILDFHLAQINGQQLGEHVGGTLPYMAPEQLWTLAGQGQYDHRADLFSAGVILHELLTGELGLNQSGATKTNGDIEQIVAERIDDIRKFEPCRTLHPDLRAVIAKATCFDLDQRYTSADQMRCDLERHLNDLPLKYAPNRSMAVRVRKWMSRHPRLSSAASVALLSGVLVTALIAVVWTSWNRLARIESVQQFQQRIEDVERFKVPLTMARWSSPQRISEAIDEGQKLASLFPGDGGATSGGEGERPPSGASHLSPAQRQRDRAALAELHFWLAEALRTRAGGSPNPEALLQAALEHNELAARAMPGRGLLLQRAELLQQLGQHDQATQARNQADAMPTTNRVDQYLASWIKGRDDPTAIQSLERLIRDDPLDFSAWLMLGHVYASQRRFDDAAACYTVCISLESELPTPRLFRGMSRMEAGRFLEALTDFDAALDLDPNDTTAMLNRGLVLMRLGRWKAALTALNRAIENGATQARIWYLRSQIRRQMGDDNGAQEDLETFLNSTPNDSVSWVVMGNRHIDEDPQQAIRDYQQALKLDPTSLDALNNLAHAYSERLGNHAAAIEVMNRIIALDSRNPKRYCERGVLYARQRDRAAAMRDARTALSMRRDGDILYLVAGLYAQTSQVKPSDSEQALNCLAAAIAQNPTWVAARIDDDPDLEPLRQLPRYQTIVAALEEVVKNATF